MLFNRRFLKSKSVTTSNWAMKELTERQLLYAANDAYAALKVYHALEARKDPGSPDAP
jgi:ribonuclease D